MKPLICFFMIIMMLTANCSNAAGKFYIIKNSKAESIIVCGNKSKECTMAANDLRDYLAKSTGAELSIVPIEKMNKISISMNRLIVGDCAYARKHGLDSKKLKTEEYIVKIIGNDMFFLGNSRPTPVNPGIAANKLPSPAVLWAVDEFLDRIVGVRWLWPGESGEYVPEMKTIAVANDLDWKKQPPLMQRIYVISGRATRLHNHDQALKNLKLWLGRHQMGARINSKAHHSYRHWMEKYQKVHPEYFAKGPENTKKHAHAKYKYTVKLCISNPGVLETVLKEWRAAGRPDTWPVAPNDGVAYCVCKNCRKMDSPDTADASDIDIHTGKVNLAARYFAFWEKLYEKMKKENPKIKFFTYSYGAYRYPPPNTTFGPHLIVSLVPGISEKYYKLWRQWKDIGASIILRPNWFHTLGWLAPYFQLQKSADYFNMARKNKMIGYSFDSIFESWGTQSPLYYMLARLSYRPEMTVEEIKEEYASAFGKAAPEILEYLNYWEKYSDKLSAPFCVGGASVENGLYTKLSKEYKFKYHPLTGSITGLPYLYPDKVIDPAMDILEKAKKKAAGDPQAIAKVNVLIGGLEHLKITRDCVKAVNPATRPKGMTEQELKELYARMAKKREELTERGVLYGKIIDMYLRGKRIFDPKRYKRKHKENLRGM